MYISRDLVRYQGLKLKYLILKVTVNLTFYINIDVHRLQTQRIKLKALEEITDRDTIKIDMNSGEFKDLTAGADKKTIAKTI